MKSLKVFGPKDRVHCPDPKKKRSQSDIVIVHHECWCCEFYNGTEVQDNTGQPLWVDCQFEERKQ